MAPTLPREVFLSHANPDRDFVDSVADVMARHAVPFWYSRSKLLGAQQWHDEIGEALRRCDWFAVVLSAHSVQSVWVKHELTYALRQDRFRGRIIPIMRELCDIERLSWTLPEFQIVDFTQSFEDGCESLLRVWGILLETNS
jgi:TIR domain